jgi:AraC-type transcriptional regulator N-terminus
MTPVVALNTSRRVGVLILWTLPGWMLIAFSNASHMLEFLDTPEDIPFLGPLAHREILYRILRTPQAGRLRAIATSGDLVQRTARAISWLRELCKASALGRTRFYSKDGRFNPSPSIPGSHRDEAAAVLKATAATNRAPADADGRIRRYDCCI